MTFNMEHWNRTSELSNLSMTSEDNGHHVNMVYLASVSEVNIQMMYWLIMQINLMNQIKL